MHVHFVLVRNFNLRAALCRTVALSGQSQQSQQSFPRSKMGGGKKQEQWQAPLLVKRVEHGGTVVSCL